MTWEASWPMKILSPSFLGSPWVVSDSCFQVGTPAATAAADGPAREPWRQSPAGEDHQHHAGHHYCHPGVRLHCRQVCRSADEEPVSCGGYLPGGLLFDRILEELGPLTVRHRQVIGACLIVTEHKLTWMLSVVRIGLSERIGCTIVKRHDHHAFTEVSVF